MSSSQQHFSDEQVVTIYPDLRVEALVGASVYRLHLLGATSLHRKVCRENTIAVPNCPRALLPTRRLNTWLKYFKYNVGRKAWSGIRGT